MDKMNFSFKRVGTGKKYWCGKDCGCSCDYVRGCYRCTVDRQKCKNYMTRFFAAIFSQLGLCGTVVGYSIVGAIVFEAIEGPFEIKQKQDITDLRWEIVQNMWEVTEEMNILYPVNWSHSVTQRLLKFEESIISAVKLGYDGNDLGDADTQWSFSGALLFSITVITTIGEI